MKIKRFLLAMLISIATYSQSFATLDSEIKAIFEKYLGNDKAVIACGVVDSISGDIISNWIKDPSMESRSEDFAYTLRDVITSTKRNLNSLGYSFKLIGIKFDKGFLLMAPINNSAFVGCFYSPELNEAKERLTFTRKIIPKIKRKL